MAAIMIVMMALMLAGPHHGFTGPHVVAAPQPEAARIATPVSPQLAE